MKDKLYNLGLIAVLMAALELSLATSAQPQTSSAEMFLDNHSSPLKIFKSYYNAINRKEYVRAYYYWG